MKNNNNLYKWLIVTFIILYSGTAFVSFYHSITFFNIANAGWLSVILSLICELGQASVLFSLLLTKNKNNWLAWSVMFLLTALQIVGNVVSSFKYISISNTIDFTYFQKSILFWVSDTNSEMFKIIIAWITGGILPIIALSMTALVADNLKLKDEEPSVEEVDYSKVPGMPFPKDIHERLGNSNVETDINDLSEEDFLNQTDTVNDVSNDLVEEINQERELNNVEKPKVVKSRKVSKPRVNKAKGKKADIKGKNINLKPVKDLDSVLKKSRGTELIQTMQSDAHKNDIGIPNPPIKSDQTSPNTPSGPNNEATLNVLNTTYDSSGNVIDQNYK